MYLYVSPYSSESGMYTYQIEYVFQIPSIWSKTNFSHKVRHQIKAEVIIFLLRHWSEVVRIQHPPQEIMVQS